MLVQEARIENDSLRWSHDPIYDHFSDDWSIFQTVVQLLLEEISVEDLPPLRVVKMGGLVSTETRTGGPRRSRVPEERLVTLFNDNMYSVSYASESQHKRIE